MLNVFSLITQHGVKKGDQYVLNQVAAWTDFDGYTCFLSDQQVTITLYFHNKYQVDAISTQALEQFELKITAILKSAKSASTQ